MVLLLILFINLTLAFLCLCIQVARKELWYGVILSLIILFCPIVGVSVLAATFLIQKVLFAKFFKKISISDLSFSKKRVGLVVPANIEQDINRVPLEEALAVSDKTSKRTTILNMLKDDYSDSLEAIRKAVDNEDSEIAHYAATTITDVVEQFKSKESVLRKECEEWNRPEVLTEYIEYVQGFLQNRLLPEYEFQKYLEGVEYYVSYLKTTYYEFCSLEICNSLVELHLVGGNYEFAKNWLDFLFTNFDENLTTYKNAFRYFFAVQDSKRFLELMDQLKKSTLVLDAETLEWVRFYN